MAKLKLEDYIHLLDRMLERDGLAEVERDAIFNDADNAQMISDRFQKRTHPKQVIKELDRRPVEAMYASLRESLENLGYEPLNEAGWDSSWTEENAIKVDGKDLSLTYYVVYDTPNNIQVIVAVSASEIEKLGYKPEGDLELWSHGDDYWHGEPEDEDDDEWWEENYVNVREIDDSEAYDLVTDDPKAPPMDWKKEYSKEEFEQLLIDNQVIMNKRRKLKESLNEAKKKPTTKTGKDKKFKKVMKEFGKGELTPYHAKSSLKSKKQGGSKQAHKQALAIAFSEAGMKKEVYEASETPELTQGQQYAVDYLKSQGLEFISTPSNIKRGTLMFKVKDKNEYWGLYKTGYIRKGDKGHHGYYGHPPNPKTIRMGVIHKIRPPQYEEQGFIDDDEYMELAHIASQKISRARKMEKAKEERGGRASYINTMYKRLLNAAENTTYDRYYKITDDEVKAAIKKLYKKYLPE